MPRGKRCTKMRGCCRRALRPEGGPPYLMRLHGWFCFDHLQVCLLGERLWSRGGAPAAAPDMPAALAQAPGAGAGAAARSMLAYKMMKECSRCHELQPAV